MAMKSSVSARACSEDLADERAPDWLMARWNNPRAAGAVINSETLMAPADSPKIVTLSGSPPREAMLRRTQRRASTWSRSPTLPDPE